MGAAQTASHPRFLSWCETLGLYARISNAAPRFDEFIILPYDATNEPPFPFIWVNYTLIEQNYGSALLRICREYDRRF